MGLLRLREAIVHAAAAAERLVRKVANDTEHAGELNPGVLAIFPPLEYVPANPAEGADGTESRAVRNAVVARIAVRAADLGREGRRAGQPEDPGNKDEHSVRGNRRKEATNARKEETNLTVSMSARVCRVRT